MMGTELLIVDTSGRTEDNFITEALVESGAEIAMNTVPLVPTSNSQNSRICTSLVVFDVSDLVYYIGHHTYFTGIQRVQSRVTAYCLATPLVDVKFVVWNHRDHRFDEIDEQFYRALLVDGDLQESARTAEYDKDLARIGVLPKSKPFSIFTGEYNQITVILIGAAWVVPDYFAKINKIRRDFNASFFMILHDLVPIFARETCDQGTAQIFETFLSNSVNCVDKYICISENTKADLNRYFLERGLAEPASVVITNGGDLPKLADAATNGGAGQAKSKFVLFVSTIEGRKNHVLAFKTWARLAREMADPPRLVCVGRYGWRADEFLRSVVTTNGLGGKIEIRTDISDGELEALYRDCLFTIYPSFYEGWGLPVTESLARGKVCISSFTSSLREAGGDLAIYVDPHSPDQLHDAVWALLKSPETIASQEAKIRATYELRPWSAVARDYLAAATAPRADSERSLYVKVVLGKEYAFRALPANFEGKVGDALFKAINDAHFGELLGKPVSSDSFSQAELMRGGGQWWLPEYWGTWSGIGGGDLVFAWEGGETAVFCAVVFDTLSPFGDSRVDFQMNGENVSGRSFKKKLRRLQLLDATLRPGPNKLSFAIASTPEQNADSRAIDKRGLMLGFVSMAFVAKADAIGRIELLEAAAALVGKD